MDRANAIGTEDPAVFITEELDKRSAGTVDYPREKLAIHSLAAQMAEHSHELMPRFIDLAMELTGTISGGLSILESDPAPGIFRWHYLRGTLASFSGATTPRNYSPCGVTLDQNAPVLATHPERHYDWLKTADIALAEVLLVPLYVKGTVPLGTLWVVASEEGHFHRGHAKFLTELASFIDFALRIRMTETQLKEALDHQQAVALEMSHRLKNVFAVTDGMIRISAKNAASKEDLAEMLSGRLCALARAHTLVREVRDAGHEVRASDLRALLQAVLLPHSLGSGESPPRFHFRGPPVACGDNAINGVALVFHELATNSAKYGALSTDGGCVHIGWRDVKGCIFIEWSERGGPTIEEPPAKSGFGRTLIKNTIARQWKGDVRYHWRADGLTVNMRIPAAKLMF